MAGKKHTRTTPSRHFVERLARIRLEAMSNLRSRDTGVEGVVIWISAGEFFDAESQHGPRIKVMLGERLTADGIQDAASVRLTDPPEVLGTLPAEIERRVIEFVRTNREVLLRHWNGELSTRETLDQVRAVEQTVDDPDSIVNRVLARYQAGTVRVGAARATLVVDEDVECLVSALKEANFRVLSPKAGLKDFDIRETLLSHRILVTRNTPDFLADAPVLDYGIIGLDALSFVDREHDYGNNQTAQLISKAVSELDLVSKRSGYVLVLKPDGRHVLRDLE